MKAIVVDDEPLARELLTRLLGESKVQVVGESGEITEALKLAQELTPDVVFLDIQMPGLDGIQGAHLFSHVDPAPQIIFVTGYSQYAVDAFRESATDYLLKPVSQERLALALAKCRKQWVLRKRAAKSEQTKRAAQAPPIKRLAVRQRGAIRLIPVEKILCAMAQNKQVSIQTRDGQFLTSHTLAHLETFLPPVFIRTHASCIVNLAAIQEILVLGNHSYAILLANGEEVPLSRHHYRELQERLGFSEGA